MENLPKAPLTVFESIQQCIDVATKRHPQDRVLCTETFIAALSGALQRDDMELANRVFSLLLTPKKEVSQ